MFLNSFLSDSNPNTKIFLRPAYCQYRENAEELWQHFLEGRDMYITSQYPTWWVGGKYCSIRDLDSIEGVASTIIAPAELVITLWTPIPKKVDEVDEVVKVLTNISNIRERYNAYMKSGTTL